MSTFRGESDCLDSCTSIPPVTRGFPPPVRLPHPNFYYPRLLGRWSPVGEVHCWDVSAPRIPWRTCILQTGVGCSLSCYELRRLMCAAALCPVRGGIRQERYTASRPSLSHPSTLNCGMWSETGLFTTLSRPPCLFYVAGELTEAREGSVFRGHMCF